MRVGSEIQTSKDETITRLVESKAYRAFPDDVSDVPGDDHEQPHGFHDALEQREAAEELNASKQHVRKQESCGRRRDRLSHHARHVRGIAVSGGTSIVYAKRVGSTSREVRLPLLDDVGHLLSVN